MLTLAKTELHPDTQRRVIRLCNDALLLSRSMTAPEVRAVYCELEGIRDALSRLLDKADGK